MRQRSNRSHIRDTFLLSGWLFADLLLGLMMIFLLSLTGGQPLPKPCTTPTPIILSTNSHTGANFQEPPLVDITTTAMDRQNQQGAAVPLIPMLCPTNTPTPTPTPIICGLDIQNRFQVDPFTVSDPVGLRNNTSSAQQGFANQIRGKFAHHATQTAGLVEVFGGGSDPSAGIQFAQDAVNALGILENRHFVFSKKTFFQPFWDGTQTANQISLFVLFYQQVTGGESCL